MTLKEVMKHKNYCAKLQFRDPFTYLTGSIFFGNDMATTISNSND